MLPKAASSASNSEADDVHHDNGNAVSKNLAGANDHGDNDDADDTDNEDERDKTDDRNDSADSADSEDSVQSANGRRWGANEGEGGRIWSVNEAITGFGVDQKINVCRICRIALTSEANKAGERHEAPRPKLSETARRQSPAKSIASNVTSGIRTRTDFASTLRNVHGFDVPNGNPGDRPATHDDAKPIEARRHGWR